MRIGTRITLTSSLLVAAALLAYGYLSLRERRSALERNLEGQVQREARLLRLLLEPDFAQKQDSPDPSLVRSLSRAGTRVEILRTEEPSVPGAAPAGDTRRERLRTLAAIRTPISEKTETAGRPTYVYLEPLQAPSSLSPDGLRVVGAVQISCDMSSIDAEMRPEILRTFAWIATLVLALGAALYVLLHRGIGTPIAKLIAGIDDVAQGDLSHVVLKERDDEVGALATRFNMMTESLRDARAETRRVVEERLTLQDHLRRSAQLATIGQVAAEIAHEVGTPLHVVSGRARAMAKKAEDPDAVQKNATIIAEQAARIARIIQRLLDFARRKAMGQERSAVDLNQLSEGTLEFLAHQLEHAGIDAEMRPDRPFVRVPGDKDQLQQVLLNLMLNAIQAMPKGGRLSVHTSVVTRRRPGLEIAPEQAMATLAVTDTGVGIPPADREKIFEAFYTSRAASGGTGLGLAIAGAIVKDHDGWIEIEDNVAAERGTIFRVFLPVVGGEPTEPIVLPPLQAEPSALEQEEGSKA
jgi:signal transduction histidine kinase